MCRAAQHGKASSRERLREILGGGERRELVALTVHDERRLLHGAKHAAQVGCQEKLQPVLERLRGRDSAARERLTQTADHALRGVVAARLQ